MRAHGAAELEELALVRRHHPALDGRDVVRVEKAEGRDVAEGPGLPAGELGVHRFAIVLDEVEAVAVGRGAHDVEGRRVAEDADADDRARALPDRALEHRHIHVERLELDVEDLELQSVLLQRVIGRGPGDRRHDHLVAARERALLLVAERRDRDEVGGRAGIDHDAVLAPMIGGEGLFEARHLRPHGEAVGRDHALDRRDLLRSPGAGRQIVEHRARLLLALPRGPPQKGPRNFI